MKIEYETTIDEMVTTQMLLLRGTWAFGIEIATYLFLWVLVSTLIVYSGTGPLVNKLFFSFLFGLFICVFPVLNIKARTRKRLKKFLVRRMGSDKPFPANFHLFDGKIEYSADHVSVTFLLRDLKKVEEVESGIFLDFIKGSVIYIPDVAFKNDTEKMQWKNKLNEICRNNIAIVP